MINNIMPCHKYLLIKNIEDETKTSSGIFIPKDPSKTYSKAIIIEKGSSELFSNDQIILFKTYQGIKLEENHLLLKDEDVLAIIKGE